MFNDIMDAKVPVHKDIIDAAIKRIEYKLQKSIVDKNPSSIYIPTIQQEAEKMLNKRLPIGWKNTYKLEVDTEAIKHNKKVKIILKNVD